MTTISPATAADKDAPTPCAVAIVPWLMLNREGLSVLVHPLTGNDYDDHSLYALWLGTALSLDLEALRNEIP